MPSWDCVWRVFEKMNRKKTLADDLMETPLKRCLTTFDLTLFGIGQMIGSGIFVLSGTVIHVMAGPGGILSYFFAGVAALLSSLCYAEFGARIPKAGSAYTYTYIVIGEFWAFIVGWNVVLEYLIGTSAVGRALSGSVDAMVGGAISNSTMENIGYIPGGVYPDFLAFAFVIIISICVASGARASVNINNIFTLINMSVIVFVACLAFSFANPHSWDTGFLPFGMQGVFAGSAACFYAFIGFDGISIAGEEAKHPEKSIPIASILSMLACTTLYVIATASLTLLVPYTEISTTAPFPDAFAARGVTWAKFVVGSGTLVAMGTSLLTSMYTLPRAVYAMSSDGLFFHIFSRVWERTQTPVISIVTFGVLAGLGALLFDIETLVEFLSIGTLLAYTIVAGAVIVLRYQPIDKCKFQLKPEEDTKENIVDESAGEDKPLGAKRTTSHADFGKLKNMLRSAPLLKHCTPGNAAAMATIAMAIFFAGFAALLLYAIEEIQRAVWWCVLILILFIFGIIGCFLVIVAHVQNTAFMTFQIPLVPLIPAASMFCNIAMMLKLSYLTWIRLAIWIAIGLVIYFAYGIRNSHENRALSSYTQILSYGGDAAADRPLQGMAETLHRLQPSDDVIPGVSAGDRYQDIPEEAEEYADDQNAGDTEPIVKDSGDTQ